MSSWQPLSVRSGARAASGPHEGVTAGMRYPLQYWLEGVFGYRDTRGMNDNLIHKVALSAGVDIHRDYKPGGVMNPLIDACKANQSVFLDVVDATLKLSRGARAGDLDEVLRLGGSVWTVSADKEGLERRVDPTVETAARLAMSAGDEAAAELNEAWVSAYGLDPDASDAWDHAIKAMEAALIPIVVPAKQ